MRFGSNPFKLAVASAYKPQDVTVAVLVYIPYLTGYFEHKFEIFKVSIRSILKHTDIPYDLLIFDNGSCPEVIQYLLDLRTRGLVQYLMLSSKNLGVLGAYNIIFSAAPGQYIAYADDDILFYPGWLSEQMKILKTFPRVGMVSGLPTWQNFSSYTTSTLALAKGEPSIVIERSKGWPRDWVEEYCESTGWNVDGFVGRNKDTDVIRLSRYGVSAFATCTHCQFLASKSAVSAVLPLNSADKPMSGVSRFDEGLDSAGFMRLSTIRPYVHHMGNRISPRLRNILIQYGLDASLPKVLQVPRLSMPVIWLLRQRGVQWLLQKVYAAAFKLFTISQGKWGES
jgi:glycosyltransferase involved in cell wall biosynthesis